MFRHIYFSISFCLKENREIKWGQCGKLRYPCSTAERSLYLLKTNISFLPYSFCPHFHRISKHGIQARKKVHLARNFSKKEEENPTWICWGSEEFCLLEQTGDILRDKLSSFFCLNARLGQSQTGSHFASISRR